MDVEAFHLWLERELEIKRKELKLSDADLAYILLLLGTRYYFKDIARRELEKPTG